MPEGPIWIEAEDWAPEDWDPLDGATDVIVNDPDGARWIATFVSYRHIITLAGRNCESGENLSGQYIWGSDLILIDEASRPKIEAVVAHLRSVGEFDSAFAPLDDDIELG
ncbi:MAG: hypothetical protein ABI353_00070 [Isosphaeraceae bacterium]